MNKKILTIQDLSCYGSCSTTIALPIISSYGNECVVLPSSILSNHTTGFKGYTCLDLTNEFPKIINQWINENIKFDTIYTGYISNPKQFDLILNIKDKLLKKNGLFIVDPAMADNGKLYPGLDTKTIEGMKKICSFADYIIPNITEACLLTNSLYKDKYDETYINELTTKLLLLGCKNVILTGVAYNSKYIGAAFKNNKNSFTLFGKYQPHNYHGSGDLFSSIIASNLTNKVSIDTSIEDAIEFVIESIKETTKDKSHWYSIKFENILFKKINDKFK